jgi:hypothetical protein
MRKFIFIVGPNNNPIGVVRKGSEGYDFLQRYLANESEKNPQLVEFHEKDLAALIEQKLAKRHKTNPHLPEYEGRFPDEKMFITMPFRGKTLQLTQTKEDQLLILLLQFLQSVKQSGPSHRFFYAQNHGEFREMIEEV